LAVNISDIAAMGGAAQYFYLGLGYPDCMPHDDLRCFFNGLRQGCRKWKVELAGGDYSRSDKMFIAITIIGQSVKPVLRSGARPGDLIGITGGTGESALGLKLLLAGKTDSPFVHKHKQVNPQSESGPRLGAYVRAMIDVSDGLLLDLSRLLKASGSGAEIDYDRIPVSRRFKQICRQNHYSEKDLVLAGGEDYQLLFAISPSKEIQLRQTGIIYHLIGKVTRRRRLLVREQGNLLKIPHYGFDHFCETLKAKHENH
jgi:thiamine-monophosphate kinase